MPFQRKNHGSERRGVFPVPNLSGLTYRQEQSKQDKARLLAMIRERQAARALEVETGVDLGNKDLPVYQYKQELVTNIDAYKAIIVGGPTGSGKSTQLPQYLYEAGYDMTVVMVPRRVIADGLGDRIREEFASQQVEGASNVVGIVHGERTDRHDDNKILVVTPNTFVRMEPEFRTLYGDKKVAIIADEIHEANLFTEIAVGVAATATRDHDDWHLVAASATHNLQTLQAPFERLNHGFVPSVDIEGRPFNVELMEQPHLNSMQAYAQYGEEHEKAMIFTSGKREIDHIIDETIRELEKTKKGASHSVVFRKLHGELSEIELAHIDDPIPEGYRLVVVASPAGMSGITIPGLTMVITDGTINRPELDSDGVAGLKRRYLSKAGVLQQIGRAGRDVAGGVGILAQPTTVSDDLILRRGGHLEARRMDFKSFADREEHEPPEIYSSNLSRVVLSVAALDRHFGDLNPHIPHPVKVSEIVKAEDALSRLGLLDDDNVVTPTGLGTDVFPVIPELGRGLYEATLPGRGIQHMARAAFIAAAIDTGGLQDHHTNKTDAWKKLIRPTTSDDFIAQLDLMTAIEDAARKEEIRPLYDFIDTFDLHPKRVERARKAARKILHSMRIDLDHIIVTPPLPDEETQLRTDFTAGMIDLVYEEVGKRPRSKHALYRNIHGDDESTTRTVSDRSVATLKSGTLVAGIPRWYEKEIKHSKEYIRFDIIDHILKVDPKVVGEFARKNELLHGTVVDSRLEGDRVVEYEQMMFGSIPVGLPVRSTWREKIPESTQRELVRQSLERPGERQAALRDIAEELEWYYERTPLETLMRFRKETAPDDLTKATIRDLIVEFARTTRSLQEIDTLLGKFLYSSNLSINKYFSDEARLILQSNSPDTISIGGEPIRVYYENGQPYVTSLLKRQRIAVNGAVFLEDGREVLLQVQSSAKGEGKKRVSFATLKPDLL